MGYGLWLLALAMAIALWAMSFWLWPFAMAIEQRHTECMSVYAALMITIIKATAENINWFIASLRADIARQADAATSTKRDKPKVARTTVTCPHHISRGGATFNTDETIRQLVKDHQLTNFAQSKRSFSGTWNGVRKFFRLRSERCIDWDDTEVELFKQRSKSLAYTNSGIIVSDDDADNEKDGASDGSD